MEDNGLHLENIFRHLDTWFNASDLNLYFKPLLWRKHFLQKDREEFSSYMNFKEHLPLGTTHCENNINENLLALRKESESWPIPIQSIINNGSKISLKLSRLNAFRVILPSIINSQGSYGDSPKLNLNIEVLCNEKDLSEDLTSYRIHLIGVIVNRILQSAGYDTNNPDGKLETAAKLKFSTKSTKKDGEYFNIYCGKVVSDTGESLGMPTEEYLKLREQDIQEMSSHKYWETSRDSEAKKLAEAAVTVDLVQSKPNNSVKIHIGETSVGTREDSSKGAVFILYNYARLVAIRKKFENLVTQNVCPSMPPIEDTDFSLLSQQDEWIILFNFLLEYPSVIRRAVENVEKGDVNPYVVCAFASKLCHAFSVYYRHVRIILEKKPHLHATMHARLSFITAIELVLLHVMKILNLPKIEYM